MELDTLSLRGLLRQFAVGDESNILLIRQLVMIALWHDAWKENTAAMAQGNSQGALASSVPAASR